MSLVLHPAIRLPGSLFPNRVCCVCLLKTGRTQSRWFSTKTRSIGSCLMKVKSRSASESYLESIWCFSLSISSIISRRGKTQAIIRSTAFIKWHQSSFFSPYACQQWAIYLRCVYVLFEGHKWSMPNLSEFHSVWLVSFSGMTIPEEDSESGQTSKYCLVAIGRLQVSKEIVAAALIATSFRDPRMIGHHWDRKLSSAPGHHSLSYIAIVSMLRIHLFILYPLLL